MLDQLDARRRRAGFRANHRGTKEMDWLLGKYADAKLFEMAGADLDLFETLIQLPDPDLQAWILEPAAIAGSEFAPLIARMRAFHKLDQPAA
jgi:antitoxin CptB